MPRVTIGVPVYNGAPAIRECLECLRRQTFTDFKVLIGDNASTDETSDICAEFAAADPRFLHIHRAENIGPLPNFVDLRNQAESPLFAWRAYDDLSAPNFIEGLVACFDRDPATRLAVCDVHTQIDDRAPRVHRWTPGPQRHRIASVLHGLFRSHASWIYGLWDRAALIREQDRVHAAYPHSWGWDHLTFLPLLLDGAVSGTSATRFKQRILRATLSREERLARHPDLSAAHALRADFERLTWDEIDARDWTGLERLVLSVAIPFYIDKRGYRRSRLLRRSLRP